MIEEHAQLIVYLIIFEATMLNFRKYINAYIPLSSEKHWGSELLCHAWTTWHNIHIPNLRVAVGTVLNKNQIQVKKEKQKMKFKYP